MLTARLSTKAAARVLGHSEGTVPITLMLYGTATGSDSAALYGFNEGITGAGVLSTQQLKALG